MFKLITLFALIGTFSAFASLSTFHTVIAPQDYIFDISFLKLLDNSKPPSFADLPALIQQQDFKDDSKIRGFLQKLLDQLAREKTEHDGIMNQQRLLFEEERQFRTQEVKDAQDSLDASQKKLSICTTERENAIHLKDLADTALKTYNAELETLDKNREKEKDTYTQRRQKLVDVQDSIDKALKYMDDLEYQASGIKASEFVQLTNNFFRASVKTGHSQMSLPVYTKLLQMHMSGNFDADQIQEIRSLLEKIKTNALEAVSNLDEEEKQNEERYNKSREVLVDLIAKLEKQSNDSDQYIADMSTCVSQETSISKMAQDKITRNSDLEQRAEGMRQLAEEEYRTAELGRTKQVLIITALQTAIQKVLKDYQEDVVGDAGKIIDLKPV